MSSIEDIRVSTEPLIKNAGEDCGRGHACEFCPKDPDCQLDRNHHNKTLLQHRLHALEMVVVVLANKGGVGKSTVSANLAASLALRGKRVGVADADIHGPNQSRFFNKVGTHIKVQASGLETPEFNDTAIEHGIKVASLAFLMEDDSQPVVWRDAYKHDFIHHLLGSFNWGELDCLVIDMPPGTGNELITLCDMLEGSNLAAVLVTTPQAVALMDSMKVASYCAERQLPVLGVVENMAGVQCPSCDHHFDLFPRETLEMALQTSGLSSLAQLPLAPEIARASDRGRPAVLDSDKLRASFDAVCDACDSYLQERRREQTLDAMQEVMTLNQDSEAMQKALEGLDPAQQASVQSELAALLGSAAGKAPATSLRGEGS